MSRGRNAANARFRSSSGKLLLTHPFAVQHSMQVLVSRCPHSEGRAIPVLENPPADILEDAVLNARIRVVSALIEPVRQDHAESVTRCVLQREFVELIVIP